MEGHWNKTGRQLSQEEIERQRAKSEAEALRQSAITDYSYSEVQEQPQIKKRRTWLWVLGWIFVFPVPLTLIMIRKKDMNKAVRWIIIVIAWLFYFGIWGAGGSKEKTSGNVSYEDKKAQEKIDESDKKTDSTDMSKVENQNEGKDSEKEETKNNDISFTDGFLNETGKVFEFDNTVECVYTSFTINKLSVAKASTSKADGVDTYYISGNFTVNNISDEQIIYDLKPLSDAHYVCKGNKKWKLSIISDANDDNALWDYSGVLAAGQSASGKFYMSYSNDDDDGDFYIKESDTIKLCLKYEEKRTEYDLRFKYKFGK